MALLSDCITKRMEAALRDVCDDLLPGDRQPVRAFITERLLGAILSDHMTLGELRIVARRAASEWDKTMGPVSAARITDR